MNEIDPEQIDNTFQSNPYIEVGFKIVDFNNTIPDSLIPTRVQDCLRKYSRKHSRKSSNVL